MKENQFFENQTLLRQNVKMIFNDNHYHDTLKTNFNKEFPEGTFAKRIQLVTLLLNSHWLILI